jgi:hypothetical protein
VSRKITRGFSRKRRARLLGKEAGRQHRLAAKVDQKEAEWVAQCHEGRRLAAEARARGDHPDDRRRGVRLDNLRALGDAQEQSQGPARGVCRRSLRAA